MDLTGIAVSLIAGLFAVLGPVLLAIIQSKVKNQQMRDLLATTVQNSLGKIQQATEAQILSAAVLHPKLSPRLAVGAQYVADHAAEAIDHVGVTPEAVADKIEAQIGLAHIATNLAVSGSATPAVPGPLDPVPVTIPARS